MTYPFVDTTNDFTPINDMIVVAPSDSQDLQYLGTSKCARALIFNGTGTIKFDTAAGTTITMAITANWFGVQYIRVKKVYATGTTIPAGQIIACY
jgi:hypothetical protein